MPVLLLSPALRAADAPPFLNDPLSLGVAAVGLLMIYPIARDWWRRRDR